MHEFVTESKKEVGTLVPCRMIDGMISYFSEKSGRFDNVLASDLLSFQAMRGRVIHLKR